MELRLVEWCDLDQEKLIGLLQGECGGPTCFSLAEDLLIRDYFLSAFASSFIHLKRPSQIAIAHLTRHAIINCLTLHPTQYASSIATSRQLDRSVEVLFEMMHKASAIGSASDKSQGKSTAFFPAMCALMLVSPDGLGRAMNETGRAGSMLAKKVGFSSAQSWTSDAVA
jgi:hypothetical protein